MAAVTDAELRRRVKRGAKWLDANVRGWEHKAKMNDLDMANGCTCVLGHIFAPGTPDRRRLKLDDSTDDENGFGAVFEADWLTERQGTELGFDLKGGHPRTPELWDRLGDLWRDEIRARRNR